MDPLRIVVIGASEGGIAALRALAARLPVDLPAAVLVVLHIGANNSALASILDRSGPLPAVDPEDGETILAGRICVAPTDHHMIFEDGAIRRTKGHRENFARSRINFPNQNNTLFSMGFIPSDLCWNRSGIIFGLVFAMARAAGGGDARRYGLVNCALKDGSLTRIRGGLCTLGEPFQKNTPHPFVVAQALMPES